MSISENSHKLIPETSFKRVDSLDYLRGAMALSVMLYHYLSWSFGTLGGESLLGKLGIYAVSIFYILSGLSLTIVYNNKIQSISDILNFFIKRLFRIFPLFWLVVTAAIAYKYLVSINNNSVFDVSSYTIFLNYSLLFGFLDPMAYLSTGAWSIGNEMVFYSLLPFIFLLQKKFKIILPVSILLSFITGLYFSFEVIESSKPLSKQWSVYINPFNQIFLFMAGVAIGEWGGRIKSIPKRHGWFILVSAFLFFLIWPAYGDKVQLVYGKERWIFSMLCIIFVLMLFTLNPSLKSWPHKVFSFLGQGCYSIYLLHPLVAVPFVFIFDNLGIDKIFAYSLSLFATLGLSWLTFKHIEQPMMNYGKKLSKLGPVK